MSLTVCQQDLVGFNPQNNNATPLVVGVATVINDAIVIDTRATPNYAGVVTLTINTQVNMSAVFQVTGTTTISVTVTANTLIYVPVIVTALNCGAPDKDWSFRVTYSSNPTYSTVDCDKPERNLVQCNFLITASNVCQANFDVKKLELSGTGYKTLNFSIGQVPACTGGLSILFDVGSCGGLSFVPGEGGTGISYSTPGTGQMLVTLTEEFTDTSFPVVLSYDAAQILCYCTLTATTTYQSCDNPNLITQGNNGTMDGLADRAAFLANGVDSNNTAPYATLMEAGTGEQPGTTSLKVTLSTPAIGATSDFNVPYGSTGIGKNVFWLMDGTNPVTLSDGTWWIKGRVKIGSIHPVQANQAIWIRGYKVSGVNPVVFKAMLFLSEYTPTGTWYTIGEIFKTSGGSTDINPYVQYEQFNFGGSVGDLFLNDGAVVEFCDIELTKFYAADCITCPVRTIPVHATGCDYKTDLEYSTTEVCVSMQLDDASTFGYTPGHALSDFTLFRQLTVTKPNGQQDVYGSIIPYTTYLTPASSNVLSPMISGVDISMGGIYTFTLINVPTWNSAVAYQVGSAPDCVCLLDSNGIIRFFKATQSRAGVQPLNTTGWMNYWVEVTVSTLTAKYTDSETYVNACALDACIDKYKDKLICSLDKVCQNNICDNECLQNYLTLTQIKAVMDTEDREGWTNQQISDSLNLAAQLCSTCNCS